ncbi:hypothetical protein H7347_06785 [Corynebacterium sp. zg-331]|nr:hypothetical protein [Corynebacterium sp. zg-331]MPV52766.1 hypothetical protein [Corynebacterium sp. zg331]
MAASMSPRVRVWLRSVWAGEVILGVTALIRGICYLPAVIPEGHRIPALEHYLPLWSWSGLWLGAGVMAMICVAGRIRRALPVVTGVLVALHTMWGGIYIAAWAAGASDRGYVTALSYITVAALGTWAFGRGDPAVVEEVAHRDA